jgi:predicted phosphodiesterase
MKLALASDLHLEFAQIELKNPGVDALILSGDIMLAAVLPENKTDAQSRSLRKRFTDFFENVSQEFPRVWYVMGNHEHYHGDFPNSPKYIQEFLDRNGFDNVTLFDKTMIHYNGYAVFGATLWSDFNKQDPISMQQAAGYMNDYRVIEDTRYPPVISQYGGWDRQPYGLKNMLTPADTLKEHIQTRISLRKVAEMGDPMIVIGHHSPSFLSVHKDFKEDKYLNGAYHSSLEHYMDEFPNIKLWTHGHTHYPFDYEVYSTRIVCNPRGYHGYEVAAKDFQLKVIEL